MGHCKSVVTQNVVYRHRTAMKSDCTSNALNTEFRQLCSRYQHPVDAGSQDYSDKPHGSWIKAWLYNLLDFLTGEQTLTIVQRSYADGTIQWIVHDLDAEHLRIFDSEQAVRVWLDKRYYQ